MATNLTAKFSLIDEMSAKMNQMANAGTKMLSSWQNASDSASESMNGIDASAERSVRSVDGAARSIAELEQSSTEAEKAMDGASSAIDDAVGSVEKMDAELSDAADQMEEFGSESEGAGESMDEFGSTGVEAIQAVGAALISAGIVKAVADIAQIFLAAAESAEKFETALAQLETIAGGEYMAGLKAEINELSAQTGIAAEDLTLVAYNAISAGTAVEDAVGMAESASKLATAGFTDTSSALSVLTTAINAYGDAAGTAEQISDSLITVQNLGVTTVADLSSTMGKAIATASAYNVSLDNLESAYISTTKAGINTMESTTYLSAMLKELGTAGTDVADIIREQTGQSFGQLMASGASLADTLEILYMSANEDAEAMMNLWGSAEAGKAANALLSQGLDDFNDNLITIQDSAGATESAYAIMADTTEHAHQRMENSIKNLGIAIGETLNPGLEKGYDLVTNITTGVTKFVQEHPTVVKAISAIAVGLGVATVAIVAVGVATSSVGKAIVATIASINTAMGPVGWAIMAVTAITAGLIALTSMLDETGSEADRLTESSREQYLELEQLNAEYDRAVQVFGETSDEALELRYEIDNLTEAYEYSKQTMAEFQQETQDLCDAMDDLSGNYKDAMQELSHSEQGDLALVHRLQQLEEQENRTAAETEEMISLIQQLNQDVPGLEISYDDLVKGADNYSEILETIIRQEYENQKIEEQKQAHLDALKQQAELEDQLREALVGRQKIMEQMGFEFDTDAATEDIKNLMQLFDADEGYTFKYSGEEVAGRDSAFGDRLAQYEDDITILEEKWNEAKGIIDETADAFEQATQTVTEGADAQTQAAEAINIAFTGIQDELNTLCEDYGKAYEAALESFEGQFGLFDQAQADASATVDAAQNALNSQLEYWTNYSSNVAQLTSLTADQLNSITGSTQITQAQLDEFMAYLQSGTQEAAGLAASMTEAMESGNTAVISDLVATHAQVQEKQAETANIIAEWQVDFENHLDEIYNSMVTTVDNLDLSAEAQNSASATMQAYIQSIKDAQGNAVSAAQEVANAVAAALNTTATVNVNVSESVPGHATGTTYAERLFIAGEEGTELIANAYAGGTTDAQGQFYIAGERGPELIVGMEGSTVFPHSETEKLMDHFADKPFYVEDTTGNESGVLTNGSSGRPAEETKRIYLEINGSGGIDISSQTDPDQVVDIMQNNLKPILYALLSEEIFEEGRLSYEY